MSLAVWIICGAALGIWFIDQLAKLNEAAPRKPKKKETHGT